MYCAICNAALQPVINDTLSTFDPLSALEFWSMNIYCTNNTVDLIESGDLEFNVSTLQDLVANK